MYFSSQTKGMGLALVIEIKFWIIFRSFVESSIGQWKASPQFVTPSISGII